MANNTKSAGGVVVNKDGDVLVVNQKGTSWSLPKGHIDEGEDALSAAEREIYEESGVSDLTLIKELGTYQRHRIGLDGEDDTSEFKTITIFLFNTSQMKLQPQDSDNPHAKWVRKEEVEELLTHGKDIEFYKKVIDELSRI